MTGLTPPLWPGSGKSGTPWLRMHWEYFSSMGSSLLLLLLLLLHLLLQLRERRAARQQMPAIAISRLYLAAVNVN